MQHKSFLYIYIILMVLTGLFFLSMHFVLGPIEAVQYINNQNSPGSDFIFKWLTQLGEIWGMAICLIILLYHKEYKWSFYALLSFAFTGIIVYINKFHLFPNSPRPRSLLNNDALIHFIDGISVNLNHSFPSGHTLAVATVATILACYFSTNRNIQLLLWILASLAGFSRVYLFQHFYLDVATSIFIGVFVNVSFYYIFKDRLKKSTIHEEL